MSAAHHHQNAVCLNLQASSDVKILTSWAYRVFESPPAWSLLPCRLLQTETPLHLDAQGC